jgi:Na+/melibiose symporter-like transporter
VRRLAVSLLTALTFLALPAVSWAAENAPEKPEGTDHTLTTIFVVAAGLPLLLVLLTLIDITVGKHRRDH